MNSDFKNNRVTDPTKVSEKQIKQVKKFCKEYFEKAVVKHQAYEKKKAEHKRKHSKPPDSSSKEQAIPPPTEKADESDADDDDDVNLSDNDEPIQDDVQCSSPREDESMTPGGSLKRKRDIDESVEENDDTNLDGSSLSKRQRSESPPVPPPPPPPMSPDNSMEVDDIEGGFKRKMDEEYELEDENTPCSRSPGKYNSHGSSPPPFPPPPPLPADMPDRSIDSYRNEQSNIDDETP